MLIGKRLLNKVVPTARRIHALSHPHRLAILSLLSREPLWVSDLVNYLNLPSSLISHHLRLLRKEGWIAKMKEGKHSLYRVSEKSKNELLNVVTDVFTTK